MQHNPGETRTHVSGSGFNGRPGSGHSGVKGLRALRARALIRDPPFPTGLDACRVGPSAAAHGVRP